MFTKWTMQLLFITVVLVAGCSSDSTAPKPEDTNIEVPGAYVFDSRFQEGESSVAYGGQIVRNLLVQDLKIYIDNLGKDGATATTAQNMLNLYEYDDALDLTTLTTAGGTPVLVDKYSSISTGKNLVGKISDATIIGYNKTADELLREWFATIATNSQDAGKLGTHLVYTRDDGLDLTQMINKVLLGALVYYQGTGVYLDGLFARDNTEARDGTDPYTSMEHGWDEAFGYYGAARDYFSYTDDQLAGGAVDYTRDSNNDGSIDLSSEYNFGFSRNAGKRDKGGSGVDFTKDAFDAFLIGRTAIVNQESQETINAQRLAASGAWEKVIAATVVHYINDTISDMSALDAASGPLNAAQKDLNKHWAEMRAFTIALQYNPLKVISDSDLTQVANLMGLVPVYEAVGTTAHTDYIADLESARSILQSAYSFSETNTLNW